MRLEKSEIRKGIFIELDCDIPTYTRRPTHEPYAKVSERLDAARARLEALLDEVRNARRQ